MGSRRSHRFPHCRFRLRSKAVAPKHQPAPASASSARERQQHPPFDPAVATPITLPLRGRHTQHWTYWSSRPYHPEQETYYKLLSNFKWEMRKGWEILFESYFTEFAATDRVSLYVMTHIWFPGAVETYGDKNNCTYLREVVQTFALSMGFKLDDLPHYAFITEDMAEVDVANVYAGVSAFVLPTRGEGWGLPAMQAMSMGLPTISTDYGGQVDFMKPWNSFLIRLDGDRHVA